MRARYVFTFFRLGTGLSPYVIYPNLKMHLRLDLPTMMAMEAV